MFCLVPHFLKVRVQLFYSRFYSSHCRCAHNAEQGGAYGAEVSLGLVNDVCATLQCEVVACLYGHVLSLYLHVAVGCCNLYAGEGVDLHFAEWATDVDGTFRRGEVHLIHSVGVFQHHSAVERVRHHGVHGAQRVVGLSVLGFQKVFLCLFPRVSLFEAFLVLAILFLGFCDSFFIFFYLGFVLVALAPLSSYVRNVPRSGERRDEKVEKRLWSAVGKGYSVAVFRRY